LSVKQPESDVDYSPSSTAEFKNECRYISIPYICLYGVDKDNVTFNLIRFVYNSPVLTKFLVCMYVTQETNLLLYNNKINI